MGLMKRILAVRPPGFDKLFLGLNPGIHNVVVAHLAKGSADFVQAVELSSPVLFCKGGKGCHIQPPGRQFIRESALDRESTIDRGSTVDFVPVKAFNDFLNHCLADPLPFLVQLVVGVMGIIGELALIGAQCA